MPLTVTFIAAKSGDLDARSGPLQFTLGAPVDEPTANLLRSASVQVIDTNAPENVVTIPSRIVRQYLGIVAHAASTVTAIGTLPAALQPYSTQLAALLTALIAEMGG